MVAATEMIIRLPCRRQRLTHARWRGSGSKPRTDRFVISWWFEAERASRSAVWQYSAVLPLDGLNCYGQTGTIGVQPQPGLTLGEMWSCPWEKNSTVDDQTLELGYSTTRTCCTSSHSHRMTIPIEEQQTLHWSKDHNSKPTRSSSTTAAALMTLDTPCGARGSYPWCHAIPGRYRRGLGQSLIDRPWRELPLRSPRFPNEDPPLTPPSGGVHV
nr:hypothetical protein CFP56_43743 [Quercus suber]